MGSHRHGSKTTAVALLILALGHAGPCTTWALDWVPTDDEMAKYRQSWNPPTHGTTLTGSADVPRQGLWFVRAYVQGQIGSGQFENSAPSKNTASPFSPDAVVPAAILYYGLTSHVMLGVGISGVYWHSNNPDAEGRTSGS